MNDDGYPSHAAIYTKLEVLEARFADHARIEDDARIQRRADRKEIALRMAGTEAAVLRIEEALKPLVAGHADHDRRINSLESSDDQRMGRDGLLAAVLRSPVFAWFAAIGSAVAALFVWLKNGGQP